MSVLGPLPFAAAGERGGAVGDLVESPLGVRIHVEILPRACAQACAGGDLPATGGGGIELLLWVAAGLLLAGAALVLARRMRRRA